MYTSTVMYDVTRGDYFGYEEESVDLEEKREAR